jgi:predicted dehydrogenase
MDTVRWGIIGVGDVTEVKSGPGFQQAERSALVAVMRRNGDKAADFARRHGVPRWYDDADELIADPAVDAVYVATPPDSHLAYTRRVAAAGKPVYVEKPMGRSAFECNQMLTACADAGVPLFVAYYRRAMPRFGTVKKLLDDGVLGAVRAVLIRNQQPSSVRDTGPDMPWRVRPEISGGGYFVDLASHTFDFLDWLLGPVDGVSGSACNLGGRYPAEDTVTAQFGFGSGAVGTGLWCYDAAQALDEVEIVGSAGTLAFSSFGQEPLRLNTSRGTELIRAPYPTTVQLPLIQAVVNALTGRGESPSTGQSALRTAVVIDAVLAGYRSVHGISFG